MHNYFTYLAPRLFYSQSESAKASLCDLSIDKVGQKSTFIHDR